MIVVHVISSLHVGGAEYMLSRLALAHDRRGDCRPIVVSLTNIGSVGELLQQAGIEVWALGLTRAAQLPRTLWRLWRLIRRIGPDVVQTWMVHADLLGGLAARLARVPVIAWGVRTTDYSVETSRTQAMWRLCAALSGYIPHRIVCAAEKSRVVHVGAGYAADRMMVIPNGFDASALRGSLGARARVRREFGLEAAVPVVGCLGRYNPAKDFRNFIAAAAVVARECEQVRFLMVGRGLDWDNAELCADIRATGFADCFVLAGERSDPAACLAAMDIFVQSSCTEGFPNGLGEAMAMGLPCVATDVGDSARLLGATGTLVPPRDADALAAAVGELMELSSTERCERGQRAAERIMSEFSMDASATTYYQTYQELLAICS